MKPILRWSIMAVLATVLYGGPSYADLSEPDQNTLTKNLETLAKGWSQADASSAFKIFRQNSYAREDYSKFFKDFFQHQAFTDHLKVYFGYLGFAFSEKYQDIRQKVNPALAEVLANKLLKPFDEQGQQLAEWFEQNPEEARSFFNQLAFLNQYSQTEAIAINLRRVYQYIWQQIPLVDAPIRDNNYQWWPHIKQQLAINYLDANQSQVPNELVGHWGGRRQKLLENYGLLLLDNDQLLDHEVKQISQLISKLPKQLLNIRFIHIQTQHSQLIKRGVVNSNEVVNTYESNTVSLSLPKLTSVNSDLVVKRPATSSVAARQHFLQLLLAELGKELAKRQTANAKSKTKLGQTVVVDGELASSISSWLFATHQTLANAVESWQQGQTGAIKQLFRVAELLSEGKPKTIAFDFASEKISFSLLKLARDEEGKITSLVTTQAQYDFTYDESGALVDIKII
ncbi:hypothetical protein H0A36_12445 [Endozoicomonas sp. SM1973]|uniref:Uncharacterized protein n=1 Tax=Spartinivicinus marinus TaxID=2994442 RepID=A0A853I5F7_9GAMM|nr:hypothetical protein [Spartinivicinus marinus]MCX4026450.1 hypothetical protein [Spartinivicinus marinus]NYZ66822.1 hypothetical protein [Spartinivicinus marinus]